MTAERDNDDAAMAGRSADGTASVVIPDITLVHRLSRGAWGDLWLGRTITGVYRAVRVIARDESGDRAIAGIRAFQRSARRQPNLADVLHIGETETHHYYIVGLADSLVTVPAFAFEKYERRTLRTELARRRERSPDEAAAIASAILRGLHQLHAQGFVHRRVTPDNIIFVDGEPTLCECASVTEQGGGAVDPSVDVAGVGAILRELLGVNEAAPEASNAQEPSATRAPAIDARERRYARALRRIAENASEPAPGARCVSAEEMAAQLDAAAGRVKGVGAGGERRARAIAIAAIAAAFVAGVWWLATRAPRTMTAAEPPSLAQAGNVPESAAPLSSAVGLLFSSALGATTLTQPSTDFFLADGFTIEMWIQPLRLDRSATLVDSRNDERWATWGLVTRGTRLALEVTRDIVASSPILREGALMHIAASWDAATAHVTFYRDGTLWSTGTGLRRMFGGGAQCVSIGPRPSTMTEVNRHFMPDMACAEVRVWRGARTNEEILSAFNRRLSAREVADTNLVAYWPLAEGTGSVARDATGRGNDLAFGTTAGTTAGVAFEPLWSGPLPVSAAYVSTLTPRDALPRVLTKVAPAQPEVVAAVCDSCVASQDVTVAVPVNVPEARGVEERPKWVDSGVAVRVGDTICITATGRVDDGGGWIGGPDGVPTCGEPVTVGPDWYNCIAHMALIGRVRHANGTVAPLDDGVPGEACPNARGPECGVSSTLCGPGHVGAAFTTVATDPGTIELAINDGDTANNFGDGFIARVRILASPPDRAVPPH